MVSLQVVTLSAIEARVKNATKREGPNALERAWQAAQSGGAQSDFSGFVLLAARLQESRPGEPIYLPLKSIAMLMDEHVTQVRRWRKRAFAMGILELHKPYVRKRRATEYFFRWSADEGKETVSPKEVCSQDGVSPGNHITTSPDGQFTTFSRPCDHAIVLPGNQAAVSPSCCVTKLLCHQDDVSPMVAQLDYSPFRETAAPQNPAPEPLDEPKPPMIEVDF
jgi:hypothetical protein